MKSILKKKKDLIGAGRYLVILTVLTGCLIGNSSIIYQRKTNNLSLNQQENINSLNKKTQMSQGNKLLLYQQANSTQMNSIVTLALVAPTMNPKLLVQSQSSVNTGNGPITINNDSDFSLQATTNHWSGNGTRNNPYIIENQVIAGVGITNTREYFKIQNCTLDGGFSLTNVSNGELLDSIINGNQINEVYLYNSSHNMMTNNILNQTAGGFYLIFSNYDTMTNNQIVSNTGDSLQLYYCNNNNFSGNKITNSNGGIAVYSCSNDVFTQNQLINIQGANGFNLAISSINNTITNNLVTFANMGVQIDTSQNDTVLGNEIINSTEGFKFNILNNSIINNNVAINNTLGGYDLSNINETNLDSNTAINSTDGYVIAESNYIALINNTALNSLGDSFFASNANNDILTRNTGLKGTYGFLISGSNNLLLNNLERSKDPNNNPIIYSPLATYYNSHVLQLNFISLASPLQLYLDNIHNNSLKNGTFLNNLSDGMHNFTIFLNVSSNIYIQQVLFIVDTIKPQISILSPTNTIYDINKTLLSYNITEINPNSTEIIVDGIKNSTIMQSGFDLVDLSNGLHNITIVVIDKAGNMNEVSILFTINVQIQQSTGSSNTTPISSTSSVSNTGSTSNNSTFGQNSPQNSNSPSSTTPTSPGFTIYSIMLGILSLSLLIYKRTKK